MVPLSGLHGYLYIKDECKAFLYKLHPIRIYINQLMATESKTFDFQCYDNITEDDLTVFWQHSHIKPSSDQFVSQELQKYIT